MRVSTEMVKRASKVRKLALPPMPLRVFSENNTTAILDANGVEVVGWMGFDKSNRTRAEHDLFARELVHRFNSYGAKK